MQSNGRRSEPDQVPKHEENEPESISFARWIVAKFHPFLLMLSSRNGYTACFVLIDECLAGFYA